MAGSGKSAPRQSRNAERRTAGAPSPPLRKPPQVLLIRKEEDTAAPVSAEKELSAPQPPSAGGTATSPRHDADTPVEAVTMADLLGPPPDSSRTPGSTVPSGRQSVERSVDEFDFDEEAFLAALVENEPVGTTGEVVSGTVISLDSDGVYVDIGGKAPGFMPKRECGLGVITNLRERFPAGLPVEVLVTREQNADGMVTVSVRALALRQSWEKVRTMEKAGRVLQVRVNGFNRGGVTCDVEGLRGFIPRSQLEQGDRHEELVGRTLGATFLEVNPDTRKLVLSEKKAATAARFAELEVGQLVEGRVSSLKPYGIFVDLGGVSGLLHHSAVSGGVLRDLREVFQPGDTVRALVTQLDPGRGRIALNTALLEGQPGEILVDREKVMAEAGDRAHRARETLRQQEQAAG